MGAAHFCLLLAAINSKLKMEIRSYNAELFENLIAGTPWEAKFEVVIHAEIVRSNNSHVDLGPGRLLGMWVTTKPEMARNIQC
jgi:hypothetical protein